MYKSESSSKYTVREWSSESHRQKFIGEEIRDEGWPFWAHSYFLGVELAKDLREGGVEITGFEVREPSNNSPRSVYVAFLGPTQKGSSLQTKGELVVLPDSSFAIKSIELKAFDRSGAGSEEENWKWTNKMDVEYVDSHVRLPKIQSVSMVSEDSSGVTNLSEAVVTHMDFEANISHDRFGLKEFDIEVIPRPESKVWILFVSLLLIVAVLVLNTCLRARRQKRAGGVLE